VFSSITMSRSFANRIALLVVWYLAAATCENVYAAQVVYVGKPDPPSLLLQQIETVTKFYGLERNVILLTGKNDQSTAVKAISDHKTIAVILSADSLASLDEKQILAALRRQKSSNIPLLIAGVGEQTESGLLQMWSSGAIRGCRTAAVEKGIGEYAIAQDAIAGQLGGHKLPIGQKALRYLTLDRSRTVQSIMAANSNNGELPVFVKANNSGQEIFFATATAPVDIKIGSDPYLEPIVFTAIAPQMMFLRHSAGEQAWHSTGFYANLTIDDAWLREPYGYVNFQEVLREMEQHNFHITLAFVPWNFDRSQPDVVSLFRDHSDRFSVCVHGNNHDHQEFGPYNNRSLEEQTKNIKQGLARMAKFSELTHVPHDPVMVFPHAISPVETLAVLKRYNFAATVNSLNVPLGAEAPADPEFALRTATMAFSNFPSLRRYSAEAPRPESQLAIDAFLGNPMLFYVHQGFFAQGSGAFSKTADVVNQLQPNTEWRSLGYIARHLYLEKLRDDGNYDIRAYGATIQIKNDHKRSAVFFVEKDEDFTLPLTVRVDGQPYPYQRLGARLLLKVPVPSGVSREISVTYDIDLNPAAINISKTSLRITALRGLSDFRDNVVSRTSLGRSFILSYTQNESAWNRTLVFAATFSTLFFVAWFWFKCKQRPSI
jgi:hypothetical protein